MRNAAARSSAARFELFIRGMASSKDVHRDLSRVTFLRLNLFKIYIEPAVRRRGLAGEAASTKRFSSFNGLSVRLFVSLSVRVSFHAIS